MSQQSYREHSAPSLASLALKHLQSLQAVEAQSQRLLDRAKKAAEWRTLSQTSTSTQHDPTSLRDLLRHASPQEVEDALQDLPTKEAELLLCDWRGIWARPEQLAPPGDWRTWLIQAGRGYGKTKSGAEWAKENLLEMPGCRGIIGAPTIEAARGVCVEGESGLLSCFPQSWLADGRVVWIPSKAEGKVYAKPGAPPSVWKCLTAEKPDKWRGWQGHWLWADELAAWPKRLAAWGQVPYVVRLKWPAAPERAGRVLVTTTPKPYRQIRALHADPLVVVTRGKTAENWHNLNDLTRAELARLKGTREGREQLDGELLDDTPGALWSRKLLEARRVNSVNLMLLTRIVVAIDPAVTATEDSDETGIICAGKDDRGHCFVLEDASMRGKPHEWASRAVELLAKWKGDQFIVEVNQGGDMVAATLRQVDKHASIKEVRASRGKRVRAEPVATAYEAKEVSHVGAEFEELEDQLCTWTPETGEASPDRLDALVWALSDLLGGAVGDEDVRSRPRRATRRTGLAGLDL